MKHYLYSILVIGFTGKQTPFKICGLELFIADIFLNFFENLRYLFVVNVANIYLFLCA